MVVLSYSIHRFIISTLHFLQSKWMEFISEISKEESKRIHSLIHTTLEVLFWEVSAFFWVMTRGFETTEIIFLLLRWINITATTKKSRKKNPKKQKSWILSWRHTKFKNWYACYKGIKNTNIKINKSDSQSKHRRNSTRSHSCKWSKGNTPFSGGTGLAPLFPPNAPPTKSQAF